MKPNTLIRACLETRQEATDKLLLFWTLVLHQTFLVWFCGEQRWQKQFFHQIKVCLNATPSCFCVEGVQNCFFSTIIFSLFLLPPLFLSLLFLHQNSHLSKRAENRIFTLMAREKGWCGGRELVRKLERKKREKIEERGRTEKQSFKIFKKWKLIVLENNYNFWPPKLRSWVPIFSKNRL